MEVLWLVAFVFIIYSAYSSCLEGRKKQETYFDKLMEDKKFKGGQNNE